MDRQIALAFVLDYPTPATASRIKTTRMAGFCKRNSYTQGDRTFHDVADAPLPVHPPEDLGDDGRVVVEGTLVQRDDRPVQMCSTAEGEPPACPPGSPEIVDAEPISGVWRTMTGRFVATVTGGDLRHVVMFPDVIFNAMSSDQEAEVGDLVLRVVTPESNPDQGP